jgi:hypothetical protein
MTKYSYVNYYILYVCSLLTGSILNLVLIYLGPTYKPYAGVIDGGDIASVKYTAAALNADIKDQTCICHRLNNLIKRIIGDYFESIYLEEWRLFIKRIRQSKPFEELWNECTLQLFGREVVLQQDTPTRWSSTVLMLKKAFSVRLAVERMRICTTGTEHEVSFIFQFHDALIIF